MKWFRDLFKDEENVANVYEEVKKKMKQEEQEKQKEEEPKKMIDIEAVGKYSFKVIDRGEDGEECYYHHRSNVFYWLHRYYIEFNYDIIANLLDEEIQCKSKFYIEIDTDINETLVHYDLEGVYKILADFMEGKNEYIMNKFKDNIVEDIRLHLKNKNIERLKELVGENKEFDIKLSFQVEDDGRFKK